MSKPSEAGTVQRRIIAYAEEIGWRFVPRAEAEARRCFPDQQTTLLSATSSMQQVRAFDPAYAAPDHALARTLANLPTTIEGNRRFLEVLRNQVHLLR